MILPILLVMMIQQPPVIPASGGARCQPADATCLFITALEKRISDLERRVQELEKHQIIQEADQLPRCDNCFDSPNHNPDKPTIARTSGYDVKELCGAGWHLERWHYGNDSMSGQVITIYRNDPSGYRKYEGPKTVDPHPDKCVNDTPQPVEPSSPSTDPELQTKPAKIGTALRCEVTGESTVECREKK